MTTARETHWLMADYFRMVTTESLSDQLAAEIYGLVCRVDFASPSFCLVDLGPDISSPSLRRFMVSLKRALQAIHQTGGRQDLVFMSAARFDQQTTTKLHRDGGPDECFLMLGYEPTAVRSEVDLADYSRCARDLGLTPTEFLNKHNPMFGPGAELLRPYTTRVEGFSNQSHQVLLVNNSMAAFSSDGSSWQGVLHTATIQNPSDDHRRVVNSTMIASVPLGTPEPVSMAEQGEFMNTTTVRRRGCDKPNLADDV